MSNIFGQISRFWVSTWNNLGDFWKNLLKFLLFLSIGGVIFYLVYDKQQAAYLEDCLGKGGEIQDCSYVRKLISDFTGANFTWILLSMSMFMVSNLNRAIRWRMLLKPLGYRPRLINCYLAIIVGYFANLGFPRMGEMARPAMLAQYERLNLEKVIGTVVVSRIIDVVMMGVVAGIASLVALDKIWPFVQANLVGGGSRGGLNFLLLAGSAIILVIIILYQFRDRIFQSRLGQRLLQIVRGFVDGIRTVGQVERPFWFVFHSLSIWVLYFLMVYVCFFAYGPTAHLTLEAGLVVFVFGALGIVIPSPGGMGTYHFLTQTALQIYGVSGEDGFSFANIAFISIQIGCSVIFGLISLLLFPILNRQYLPDRHA